LSAVVIERFEATLKLGLLGGRQLHLGGSAHVRSKWHGLLRNQGSEPFQTDWETRRVVRQDAGRPGVTHGLDTSFLLAVEIVEYAHHSDALRFRLAATYRAADVTSLLTLNATDFTVFDELACVPIPALRSF
jgi:hypothetical protein